MRRLRPSLRTKLKKGKPATPASPSSPVQFLSPPAILGSAVDGSDFNLRMAVVDPANPISHMDARLRDTDGNALIARQTVQSGLSGSFDAVGKSLILDNWAVESNGREKLVSSAPFGPIAPATLKFIGAWAFSNQIEALPIHPYMWQSVFPGVDYRYPQDNFADPALKHGFTGSATSGNFSQSTFDLTASGRLAGTNGLNSNPSAVLFQADVGAGTKTIRLFAGIGRGDTSPSQLAVWDGPTTGALLVDLPLLAHGAEQVRDINGNLTSIADWEAASLMGGTHRDVTVTNGYLSFGRTSAVNGAPRYNCFAAFEVLS